MDTESETLQPENEWWTPKQVAAYLNIKIGTLAVWRCTQRYPLPYYKPFGRVQYKKSEVEMFKASGRVAID